MNWLKKTLNFGEKIKRLIKKRPSKIDVQNSDWESCCKGPILKKDLEENLWVCPGPCSKHFRINCKQRFDLFFGKGEYEILKTPIPSDDPLEFADSSPYIDKLKKARQNTGQDCAVLIAKGKINNIPITVGAVNFFFMGGSIATSEGEAIIYGIQNAINNKTPFLMFTCGGGQRMHESPLALTQMTRTTLAINELKKNNLPYIVCFTDPTAGGITASFAMLGDIQVSEPGSLIAFAGRRVIEGTVKEDLPENFQKAEHVQSCGFVDSIIERKDLSKKIGALLSILLNKESEVKINNNNETSENNIENREAS
tara:strand:- start:3963 stop:4895 length:933 start_codon:yes stop_codon:yes gene_type:complete